MNQPLHSLRRALPVAAFLLVGGCAGGDNHTASSDASDTVAGGADSRAPGDRRGPDATLPSSADPECSDDAACAGLLGGLSACHRAACIESLCAAVPVEQGTSCQPEDKCLEAGSCNDGACLSDVARNCDDGNGCTVDSCEPAVGCLTTPDSGSSCDDGELCTKGDVCDGGVCTAGPTTVCDDGNACTADDACDPATGECVFAAVEACDDDNYCTDGDACDPATGDCVGTTRPICSCDDDAYCQQFDDGDLCNGLYTCHGGVCEPDPTTVVDCQQPESDCQVAVCVADTGACQQLPVEDGAACEDGDLCTIHDKCAEGACAAGPPVDCYDFNPCTVDACSDGLCLYTFDEACACDAPDCPPVGFYGDALPLLASIGSPVESVGVEVFDGHAITCGGFGLGVFRLHPDQGAISATANTLPRCQNIEPGPLVDGHRIVYVTHHGDAYVTVPALHTLSLDVLSGHITLVDTINYASGVSVEGLAYDGDSTLWVTYHEGGLRRFDVAADGELTPTEAFGGFDNAYRLTVSGAHVYVADGGGGLKVVDRATGAIVGAADTAGFAKDLVVTGTMAVVAASAMGIEAFDVSDPTDPVPFDLIYTWGTALTIDLFANGTLAVVANHDDVAVVDVSHPDAFNILASDRGTNKPNNPRNLAAGADGDLVVAGEWLGLGLFRWTDDLVAPELQLNHNTLTLAGVAPGVPHTEVLQVTNRGWLELVVTSAEVASDAIWNVNPANFTLQPGESVALAVTFEPPGPGTFVDAITLVSNDPDESTTKIPLIGNPTTPKIDVGDFIDEDFDFLDLDSPLGEQSIANLEGHILVLAYFATF